MKSNGSPEKRARLFRHGVSKLHYNCEGITLNINL